MILKFVKTKSFIVILLLAYREIMNTNNKWNITSNQRSIKIYLFYKKTFGEIVLHGASSNAIKQN